MPYFPYSRQSKKKSHRGAITARMIANLLHVAGVNHVITIDLHASQMQGFFKCPVDNLVAEPLLARWIRNNVPNWRDTVVVSKNPGGTKRVTSLADALKLSFGIVTTDRRRPGRGEGLSLQGSAIFERLGMDGTYETPGLIEESFDAEANICLTDTVQVTAAEDAAEEAEDESEKKDGEPGKRRGRASSAARKLNGNAVNPVPSSPLIKSTRAESFVTDDGPDSPRKRLMRTATAPSASHSPDDPTADEFTDEVRLQDLRVSIAIKADIYSVLEMLFMVVWSMATLLTMITPLLPCRLYLSRTDLTAVTRMTTTRQSTCSTP